MTRNDWRLIETAPKDGTEIIGVHVSEWGDRRKTVYGPWTIAFRSGGWQSSWDDSQVIDHMSDFGTDYKSPDLNPTHWMPLPAPPLPQTDTLLPDNAGLVSGGGR